MTTALYRHFDTTGKLLYIGISVNAFKRFSEHKDQKDWSSDICSMTIEYFDTRIAALAAEKNAIKAEKPLHNVTYNRPDNTVKIKTERCKPQPLPVDTRTEIVYNLKGSWILGDGRLVNEETGLDVVWHEHIEPLQEWLATQNYEVIGGYVWDGNWRMGSVEHCIELRMWEYQFRDMSSTNDSVTAYDTNNGWDVWAKKHEEEGKKIREQAGL